KVVRESTPWTHHDKPRTAGISSFGFSGTNAHVIVEEAPTPTSDLGTPFPNPQFFLLPLSARTPEALGELVARYDKWLDANPQAGMADVCHTAAVGRSHLEHRAALVVDSRERTRELLGALAEDRPGPGLFRGVSKDPPKTAWLFTGQGS